MPPQASGEGENAIEDALLEFIAEQGTPGMMPTQEALSKAGRNDLAIAISRFGGGWEKISARLGLQLAELPKGQWKNFENVKAAILAFNERRGRPGEMPMKHDLDFAGLFSLVQSHRHVSAAILLSPSGWYWSLGVSHSGHGQGDELIIKLMS